jgi:aconitate hydratase
VKNKVMEFVGDGISNLSVDFRNGIDVMTTETACWSSIWKTDDKVREYLKIHGRAEDYRELKPADAAYYDGFIIVDLSKIESCIALPFHPSNVHTIYEFQRNAKDILAKTEKDALQAIDKKDLKLNLGLKYHDGGVWADQAVIAGCSGGIFENIMAVYDVIRYRTDDDSPVMNKYFSLSIYPESQPTYLELIKSGAAGKFLRSGVLLREAFCGPCFGAGDTPANGELSIRHVTRNFLNREGSKPGDGQLSYTALMDSRSIAATAVSGGLITPATDFFISYHKYESHFENGIYKKRVYNGIGNPLPETELVFGPNIKDWPEIPALPENLLIKIVSFITDSVTTTDELIPSGETSSYRSNPLKLAEFTLSRKDPSYVGRAKNVLKTEERRRGGDTDGELDRLMGKINGISGCSGLKPASIGIGSAIFARKPGDGSAREQAASCQRVLGGSANFALEYATKRYRSNLINWGMLPFIASDETSFELDNWIFIPGIKDAVLQKKERITAYALNAAISKLQLTLGELTEAERQILADGCLINYYSK